MSGVKEREQICPICPHACRIKEGETGFCNARVNDGGKITAQNYGRVTAIALDPIEKKPLRLFMPGSMILSVGSYGCNFRCGFCQNHNISMVKKDGREPQYEICRPDMLVEAAQKLKGRGNIGIAFTYNEPLIGYEFVMDTARLAKENGLMTVAVTNGYICEEPFLKLLPFIDAVNIDLKSFSGKFYKRIGGDIDYVKSNIALANERCHVEVTTLVIPGENDGSEEMHELCRWLSSVGKDGKEIPLHISRFFPNHEMMDRTATPPEKIFELADIAQTYIKYVYKGNI